MVTMNPRRLRMPRASSTKAPSRVASTSAGNIAMSTPACANQRLKFSGERTSPMGVPTMARSWVEAVIMSQGPVGAKGVMIGPAA